MRRPSVKRRLAEHDWIEITPLDRHEWRISDARIPSSDPAHLLGYIEQQSHHRFEILWMTDPIRWGYAETFTAALNGFADAEEFVGRIEVERDRVNAPPPPLLLSRGIHRRSTTAAATGRHVAREGNPLIALKPQ
jgi:hypothetical protein